MEYSFVQFFLNVFFMFILTFLFIYKQLSRHVRIITYDSNLLAKNINLLLTNYIIDRNPLDKR